ncbi:MAG: hypothetical protein ACFB16_11815 [Phormidesmis sp.]
MAAVLLAACSPGHVSSGELAGIGLAKLTPKVSAVSTPGSAQLKTESVQGEFIGDIVDCDGDGLTDDARIDFDGDGVSDECVDGAEAIPEPPFQQSYTPTSEAFNSLLPAVGWNAQYQCADGLYEVTLRRPSADKLEYSSEGLTLSTPIVYDDLDPNLNQPLIIQDSEAVIRYAFTQQNEGEFYEYAIADYSGNVGLYVYQTGEQIVAAPCVVATNASPASSDSAE